LKSNQLPREAERAAEPASRDARPARKPALRIIGIDPGLASVGYGVLESGSGRLRYLCHGCIETSKDTEMGARLLDIFATVSDLVEEWRPDSASMESLYFWKNVTSGIAVSEAKGVIRLAFARAGVPLVEYSPTAIKQAVSGSARADKEQVQEMVRLILGLEEVPRPDHSADALAAAICRANHSGPLSEK
jgi:crossover junction endodeoxyribonuclease RuvC